MFYFHPSYSIPYWRSELTSQITGENSEYVESLLLVVRRQFITASLEDVWKFLIKLYIYLEKAMATHSSTLAWKILWMEEPCREGTALEKTVATHSSILAWRIPGTEEPGELWGRTVRHNWSNLAAAAAGAYIYLPCDATVRWKTVHTNTYVVFIHNC